MMLNGDLFVGGVIQSIMRSQRKKIEKGMHAWVPPCAAYMTGSLYWLLMHSAQRDFSRIV
jgi:hypothetical protein